MSNRENFHVDISELIGSGKVLEECKEFQECKENRINKEKNAKRMADNYICHSRSVRIYILLIDLYIYIYRF